MEPSPEPSPPITTTFAAGGGDEPYSPTNSSSLFPLFHHSAPTAESQWLSNPSFSFDASSLHIPATSSSSLPPTPLSPSSDDEEAPKPAPAKYELLPSSPSPPASDEERGSKQKDMKRRKRRREKERYDGATASRKPGVRAWAGSETKPAKDYYFDAKGDQDNLAFGSIYRNPSIIVLLFALSFEWSKAGSDNRIHSLFERALADDKLQKSVLLWRCYLGYEAEIACNASAARHVFFRAIHACPWSKRLWVDGFQKLSSILTLKELSDLQEVMSDKELHIRTDIYEILLQDETDM